MTADRPFVQDARHHIGLPRDQRAASRTGNLRVVGRRKRVKMSSSRLVRHEMNAHKHQAERHRDSSRRCLDRDHGEARGRLSHALAGQRRNQASASDEEAARSRVDCLGCAE